MLAKLLSLLLQAKSGAISGVFLLGATGALVSVSASNGVTTVTITEASPSPATDVVTTEPTKSPEASKSPKPSSSTDPLSKPAAVTAPTTACTDQEKVNELQVQRVDTAFSGFHTDLMKLRGTRAAATLQTADELLKAIRQAAVKAIHASATCTTQDEDKDETETDEDSQTGASTTSTSTDTEKDENDASDKTDATKPTVTFTVTDPKLIADQALAAMQTAFDTAKNSPATTAKTNSTDKTNSTQKTDQKKQDGKSGDHRSGHDD